MYRHRVRLRQSYIVWMVMGRLMERMGSVPNLAIKWSFSIHTMLNFNGDEHGDGDGDGTCKQALIASLNQISLKTTILHSLNYYLFKITPFLLKKEDFTLIRMKLN